MSATMTRGELLVSVLPLQPGDVLLVQLPRHAPPEEMAKIGAVLTERLPDNRVLFVTEDIQIGVWRPVEPVSEP
jgi:hypothetical protein